MTEYEEEGKKRIFTDKNGRRQFGKIHASLLEILSSNLKTSFPSPVTLKFQMVDMNMNIFKGFS